MRYEKGSFITVPSRETLRGLHPTAQTLYMWLCAYANETGKCFPSRKTLAEDVGCSEDTIDKMLGILVETGLVKKRGRVENGEKLSNLYTVLVAGGSRQNRLPPPPESATLAARNGINSNHLTQSNELTSETDVSRVVEVSEEERPKREKRDTEYLKVYELFTRVHGRIPLNWRNSKTQIQSAKNLLEEHSLEEIEDAVKWYKDLRHIEHCYDVSTPWDLDTKWLKFEKFVEKQEV